MRIEDEHSDEDETSPRNPVAAALAKGPIPDVTPYFEQLRGRCK